MVSTTVNCAAVTATVLVFSRNLYSNDYIMYSSCTISDRLQDVGAYPILGLYPLKYMVHNNMINQVTFLHMQANLHS